MELKEGMYVRSKINGMISKITDIEQFEELGQIVERYILDNNYNVGFCSTEKDSVIASHNIIDLIEAGDYVNGLLVTRILEDNETKKKYINLYGSISEWEEEDIKSIVTKEQFERMSYKVEE